MRDNLLETIKRTKEGDQDAATELYNLTNRMVYFTSLKIIGDEDAAYDISQDTYVKVFSGIKDLRDGEAFIPWIKTITINLSKNYMKKSRPILFNTQDEEERVLRGIPETNEEFLPEDNADNREKCRLIMSIVDSLPETQRMSVILYYYNGLSVAEVSKIMETSEGTTKSRLNLARKYIKDKVEDLEKEGAKLYGFPVLLLSRILDIVSLDYNAPEALTERILVEVIGAVKDAATTGVTTSYADSIAEISGSRGASGGGSNGGAGNSLIKMTKVNKKLLSIVAAVVLTAGSALILPELIGGSPEIEITSVVPTQSETETIIEVGMEEEPEEDMDMDIPDSWLVGSMKDEVYAVLGAPDVKTPVKNIDDYRDMDRIEAIKLLWGMEAGGKTYYRVPWEEANDILDGKSEDFKLPYHEYYSDKTHLLFDHTDALYAADFYTDRYSFYGIKVGLTLTEAMEKLKDKESAKFLGYDRGAKATPNASFGVDGITLQLMYSADDEIITEISLWAFVISEWEQ